MLRCQTVRGDVQIQDAATVIGRGNLQNVAMLFIQIKTLWVIIYKYIYIYIHIYMHIDISRFIMLVIID